MTAQQGKVLRQIGLVLEVLAILGLLALYRGKDEIWRGFPLDPATFLKVCLGVGFMTWSVGTWAIYRKR